MGQGSRRAGTCCGHAACTRCQGRPAQGTCCCGPPGRAWQLGSSTAKAAAGLSGVVHAPADPSPSPQPRTLIPSPIHAETNTSPQGDTATFAGVLMMEEVAGPSAPCSAATPVPAQAHGASTPAPPRSSLPRPGAPCAPRPSHATLHAGRAARGCCVALAGARAARRREHPRRGAGRTCDRADGAGEQVDGAHAVVVKVGHVQQPLVVGQRRTDRVVEPGLHTGRNARGTQGARRGARAARRHSFRGQLLKDQATCASTRMTTGPQARALLQPCPRAAMMQGPHTA